MKQISQIALVWWLYATDVCAQKPEEIHFPLRFTTTEKYVNGTQYEIDGRHTPDWRIEEVPPGPGWNKAWYKEEDRPYRFSPYEKQASRWDSVTHGWSLNPNRKNQDNPRTFGCYCCTVFKRLTPLSTCAVITSRHILTTATATELVLKDYDKEKQLDNILGFWYDRGTNLYNSSMYTSVSRIHYHPRYVMPNNINASHPIPCIFDLAVWAATYPMIRSRLSNNCVMICMRPSPSALWSEPAGPSFTYEMGIVVGFQFMWYYKKVPMPWFKYVVRTRQILSACPKSEWGWFYCVDGKFAQLGMDSGGILHRNTLNKEWKYDGLIGLNAFSMTLRARKMTHYFTSLYNYNTMEFLYDAYMGTYPYRYLDDRFYDTQMKAPIPKTWHYIEWEYTNGDEHSYYDKTPPFFK